MNQILNVIYEIGGIKKYFTESDRISPKIIVFNFLKIIFRELLLRENIMDAPLTKEYFFKPGSFRIGDIP